MSAKVTRQTREKAGLSRQEFFDYKKNKVVEMVKNGVEVPKIAKELGLTEKEMYSFISRVFGGVRRIRESNGSMPVLQVAGMNTAKVLPLPTAVETFETPSFLEGFGDVLKVEKTKIIRQFKTEIEKEAKQIIKEVDLDLKELKENMIEDFKTSLIKDITAIGKTL